jgi:hypothetical protein
VRYGKQKIKQETGPKQRKTEGKTNKNTADHLRGFFHHVDPLHAAGTDPILVTTFAGIIHSARHRKPRFISLYL